MELRVYKNWTRETAIYSDSNWLKYLSIGLAAEVLETVLLLTAKAEPERIKKEISDCMWFISEYCRKAGLSMDWEYTQLETRAARVHAIAIEVPDAVSSLVSIVAKHERGDYELSGRLYPLTRSVLEIFAWVVGVMEVSKYDLEEILDINYEKLTGRKERGTLAGSGEER